MNDSKKFTVIAITSPLATNNEAEKIAEILYSGKADFVHIRKPGAEEKLVEALINRIPESLHCCLKLHDHYPLAKRLGCSGIQLNSRNSLPASQIQEFKISDKDFTISKSMHSLKELENARAFDYVTLSPIFPSISKAGYCSNFDFKELQKWLLKNDNVFALGGVTPDKFSLLKEMGFAGAAMLGYFWQE